MACVIKILFHVLQLFFFFGLRLIPLSQMFEIDKPAQMTVTVQLYITIFHRKSIILVTLHLIIPYLSPKIFLQQMLPFIIRCVYMASSLLKGTHFRKESLIPLPASLVQMIV